MKIPNIHSVILGCRVSSDPRSSNGVLSFSVVWDAGYYSKDKNMWIENSTFFYCAAFGKLAEKTITKGESLIIEGKIEANNYRDANGQDKKTHRIRLSKIIQIEALATVKESEYHYTPDDDNEVMF